MLNFAVKVVSRFLATRLKKVISNLVSSDQTAYVPDRYIGESVRLTSDLLEYTNIHNLPGYMVTIDIEKAFDSVDHTFLLCALRRFGLGNNFKSFKEVSKVPATRLKKVISNLVSSDQTAYVPDRYIGEFVRLTSDLLEYTTIHNLPGYMVTIDIEKAFDSVDHTFLLCALRKFGFGNNFIKWVKIILNRQES